MLDFGIFSCCLMHNFWGGQSLGMIFLSVGLSVYYLSRADASEMHIRLKNRLVRQDVDNAVAAVCLGRHRRS